jgi:hypothetical protein
MNNYKIGDYVWCQNGNFVGLIGKVCKYSNEVPENIKRSKRSNTLLLLFLHDNS